MIYQKFVVEDSLNWTRKRQGLKFENGDKKNEIEVKVFTGI